MSVLLKGIDLPKEGRITLQIGYDGSIYSVSKFKLEEEKYETYSHAVEVLTPHGRLIDADKIDFRNDAMHDGKGNLVVDNNFVNGIVWANNCIDMTPTIIEAERSEE